MERGRGVTPLGDQDIFDGTGMELRNLLVEPDRALCSPSTVCMYPGSTSRRQEATVLSAGPQTRSRTGSNDPSPNVDTTGLGKRGREAGFKAIRQLQMDGSMETRRTGTGDQRSSCHDQQTGRKSGLVISVAHQVTDNGYPS